MAEIIPCSESYCVRPVFFVGPYEAFPCRVGAASVRFLMQVRAAAMAGGQAIGSSMPVFLRRMRPRATACRVGTALSLLAASPRPALRPGREPDRRTRRTRGLAAELRRRPRRQVLRQPRMHDDQFPGTTSLGRAAQPPAGSARTLSSFRTLDGLRRPRTGNLLHRSRHGHGHRSGRGACGRPPTAPHRRRPRDPAASDGCVRRFHDALARAGPPERNTASQRRDRRGGTGHHA